jgi:GNAT superfamily N-acetyltransferase
MSGPAGQSVSESARIVIRLAEPGDVDALLHLYAQLILNVRPTARDVAKALVRISAEPDRSVIVVGELDGEVVATCQLIVYDNLIRSPQRKAVIDSVVVDEPHRNHRIGTTMIKWSLAELKRRGCAIIYVSSASIRDVAPKLYKSSGFETFGTAFYVNCAADAAVPDWGDGD